LIPKASVIVAPGESNAVEVNVRAARVKRPLPKKKKAPADLPEIQRESKSA
jgi:hypothetical protein